MIDAYCHCGLSKYRPVADVNDAMRRAGVRRAVLVQHMGEFDNRYLARLVADQPARFAAVGLIDPAAARWRADLLALEATGHFRGVRVAAETLDANPRLCAAILDLGLVLVVYIERRSALSGVRRLAAGHPSATIVLSHLGGPGAADGRLASGREILELADEPAVHVTLSGLSMYCPYPYSALDDFIAALLESYGADRVMWGSNFPVCGDAAAYARDLAMVRPGTWGLDAHQADRVVRATAARLWFGNGGSRPAPRPAGGA